MLRFTLSLSLAAIAMITLAGLWHELVMSRFYEETGASHEGTLLIFLAYFILSAAMTYLYTFRSPEKISLSDGVLFGAFIGFLWVFPHELAMAAAHGEPLCYVVRNGAWHLVEQAIGGGVIAWFYRGKSDA